MPTFRTVQRPNAMYRFNAPMKQVTEDRVSELWLQNPGHRDASVFSVRPTTAGGAWPSLWDQDHARPERYDVWLEGPGVRFEIAPGEKAAIAQFDFARAGRHALVFGLKDARGSYALKDGVLEGVDIFQSRRTCEARVYLRAAFDVPPTAVEADGATTTLVFGERAETVRMRFAVSYLSPEQAARNLAAETPAFDLDALAPGGGAPEGERDWSRPTSWSESDDPGFRFHSGEAVYETAFDLTAAEVKGREFRLDLGRVEVIAEVELNGVALGTAWRPPYRLPATAGVRAGRNTLRVRVANTWRNRLLGDRREPADLEYGGASTLPDWGWIAKAKPGRGVSRFPDWLLKGGQRPSRGRVAVPLWDYYANEDLPEEALALAPSGLLGPVRLDSRAAPSPVSEKSKEEIIR